MKSQSIHILFILFHVVQGALSFYDDYYDLHWDTYEDNLPEIISFSPEIEFDKSLNITDRHISILNEEIFEFNNNLTKIILKNNKIQSIDVHTFNKFKDSLFHLEITSNNLSTFNIEPIQRLRMLNLSNNSLITLNSTNFQKLDLIELAANSNNLTVVYCRNVYKSIDLSHNNISNICNFSKTIVDINLSYNNIKYIPNYTFKGLTSLKYLYLSHNKIVTLQYDTFDISTVHLRHLNLSHNMFAELNLLHFKYIKSIYSLDLSYNNISIVHQHPNSKFGTNTFKIFHKLYLEGNPIKKINMTNLSDICYNLNGLSISFSEISCSMLQNYISEFHDIILKGPVKDTENINGIKCDSSLNTLENSDPIDGMIILLNKVNAILIVLAFFFSLFVIVSIIITVKRFRANILG